MRVVANRPSAWLEPIAASVANRVADGRSFAPFTSDTVNALATLGLNLAIAGALCASYALGYNPPSEWRALGDGYVPVPWHPGCGRSAK